MEKIAIVTGANSGMGMATVKALSDQGITVIMLCRNEKRGLKAYNCLKNDSRKLDLMLCDLSDFDSIYSFVDSFNTKYDHLDILVNNAGFISLDRQITKEGLERQFGINHIGHFLLTTSLIDCMDSGSRIINVASGAHKTGRIHFDDITLKHHFNVISAYSQSKLANVLFTRELARRLKYRGITVNCCHPGAVATNMGVDRETGFGKTITGMLKPFFLTPEEGCRTAVYLALSEDVKDISGEYFFKCKIAKSSKQSKDMVLARRLYEFSEEIVSKIIQCIIILITIGGTYMNITVYLGANEGNQPFLKEKVIELGTWIGNKKHTLIYGGSKSGLMGIVAQSALEAGAKVIGIEPQMFVDLEYQYDEIDELIVTKDMAERKRKLIEYGDVFITFPGGTGSLEEVSEVMSMVSLDLLNAPCIIYNLNGYYNPLKELCKNMLDLGLSNEYRQRHIYFCSSLEEIERVIDEFNF